MVPDPIRDYILEVQDCLAYVSESPGGQAGGGAEVQAGEARLLGGGLTGRPGHSMPAEPPL